MEQHVLGLTNMYSNSFLSVHSSEASVSRNHFFLSLDFNEL